MNNDHKWINTSVGGWFFSSLIIYWLTYGVVFGVFYLISSVFSTEFHEYYATLLAGIVAWSYVIWYLSNKIVTAVGMGLISYINQNEEIESLKERLSRYENV